MTTHLPGTAIALGLESGRRTGWRLMRAVLIISMAIGVAALTAYALAIFRVRAGWLSFSTILFATISVLLGWTFVARASSRRLRFPRLPDPSARVAIVGTKTELGRLFQLEPLRDEAFEPVVIKLGPDWFVYPVFLFNSLVLVALQFGHQSATNFYFVFMLAPTVVLVHTMLFPRYARVVPGRLDLLHCSVFGRRLRLKQSYDLRTPSVLVDLNDRCLLLCHSGGRTQPILLPNKKQRRALLPVLLRAAISTAPTAPLPDDALVG